MGDKEYSKIISKHFLVRRDELKTAGFCDIRIKLHELALQLANEGWVDLEYPIEFLEEDFKNICEANTNNVFCNRQWITAWPSTKQGGSPGRIISSHFMKWGNITFGRPTLAEQWQPRPLYNALQRTYLFHHDLTRTNVVRSMMNQYIGFKYVYPVFFRNLFENIFKIDKPKVLDFNPHVGAVAMATAASKGSYLYRPTRLFKGDVPQKMCGFLQMDAKADDGSQVDLAISGEITPNTAEDALELIKEFKPRADLTAIYVRNDERNRLERRFPPKKVFKVSLMPKVAEADWLMLF